MRQILIGDIIFRNDVGQTGKVKAVTHKHVLMDVYNTDYKLIREQLLTLMEVQEGIKDGFYTHYFGTGQDPVISDTADIQGPCNHQWTELTLFTSSIIYCPKCNKEKGVSK